jgi:Subtilase family/Bacterial Ig-like domain (group 3)/Bacterial cadherin-like domain/Bacterial Ig domain
MRRMSRERVNATLIFAILCALLLSFIPLEASAQSAGSSLLVKLVDGLSPALQADVIARNGGVERSVIPALRLHVIDVLPSELDAVRANYQGDPRVVSVEENRTRLWETIPADPLYGYQWALPRIAWDQVFGNVTPTGTARVALLDTGVDALHPDLAGKVVPGASILDGSNGMTDPSGHGTWLAGIIAAQTDNVPVEGIAGVAYAGVTVMPVTVLNANGEGQDSDVIAGVIWAADHGANVILMAFSNPGFSPNLQDAIDYAWSKGIVLVAAVGNSAVSDPTFPAGDRGVMGVAATDANDALAYFSNDGQAVFIAAPGVDISTTDIGDVYVTVSGTSTSAAIVAGAAAFMKAVDPTLTNGIIVGRLARNADPAGTQSQTGNGRINLARAMADTSTEFIEPAGAAPVGAGGPFVGPYRAAAINTAATLGSSLNPSSSGASVTFTATVTVTAGGQPVTVGTVKFGENGNANCSGGTFILLQADAAPNASGQVTFTTSTLSIGGHTIRACYSGTGGSGTQDSNASITQTVNPLPTTTSISPASKFVGEAAFSITVTGTNFQNGAVVRFNGTNRITSGSGLTTRTASILASDLTATGTFSITVANPDGGVSNAQTFTVNKADTTTNVSSSVNPTVFGQSVTFTATLSVNSPGSGTPTGTVTFKDGATTLGTGAVNASGQATFSISTLTVASHSITATYGGDANFNTSTSTTLTQTVNKAATSTSVTSSVNPSVFGQAVMFTATVAATAPGSGTPTGTVTFKDGTTTLGTGALNAGGQATFSSSTLAAGSHAITAAYEGDGSFTSSTSTTITQTVNKATTTTTLTSAPNASTFGQSVTFTATVTSTGGTPTGTVTFKDGATTLGTGVLNGSGVAALSTSGLTAGTHSITAEYGGDSNFNTSTSNTVSQVVNKAATTTALTSAPNPSTFGQSVTFTATVASAAGTPTGTVTFKDGGTTLGTGVLSAGVATYSTSTLTGGTHSITAEYGGDSSFDTSASNTVSQVVNKADTTTTLTSAPNPAMFGQSVTFTATVTSTAGTPTGTVTFKDGATTLGTGPLNAGGVATFTTSALTAGTHSITVAYSGDANFNISTSDAVSQVVDNPPTATADYYVTLTDVTLIVNAPGVLANDNDVDAGQGTSVYTPIAFDTPTAQGGTLHYLHADGSFSYTPPPGFIGTDSFTYQATDTIFPSDTVTVTIAVRAATTTPVAENDVYRTTQETQLNVAAPGVLDNDQRTLGDSLTAVLDSGTSHGTLALNPDGSFTYMPAMGFTGRDTFTYHVHDDTTNTDSNVGMVTITVQASGANPVADNDAYRVDENATFSGNVLGNDTGTSLSAELVSGPLYGTVTLYSNGSFSYHSSGFAGRDSFIYRAKDNTGAYSNLAMVRLLVSATTTTTVSSNHAPSVFGQSVTFTATVSPAVATGSVQFQIDGVNFGSPVAVSGGTATSGATSTLSVGDHTVKAVYTSDSQEFLDSTSGNFTQTVNKADSLSTVTSSVNPSVFGQSVTFTATVTAAAPGAGTPSGSVMFKDGATTLSTQSLSSGQATFTTSALTVASHSITAEYSGDGNFNATGVGSSTAPALTQVVNKADSLSTVTSSVNPSVFGQSVTFTATVTAIAPGVGTPTGTVTFKDGSTTLSTQTLSGGQATYTTAALSVATHSITATYSGDGNFNATGVGGSTAPTLNQVVNKADSLSTVTSSVNPSVFGQSVTFTATVTAVSPGVGTPSGTVTFKDGSTTLSTQTLVGGQATFTTSALSVGAHSTTATYTGDSNFNATGVGGSTAPTLNQVVNKADSLSTVTSSANPSVFGQSVTFTVTMTVVAPGAGSPTGTVTFKDGGTTLGTQTLSAGQATYSTTALSVTTHSITATYSGDGNFNATGVGSSTAPALSQVVNKAESLSTVTSSVNPSVFGQSVTFTATVTAVAPGVGTPTGTVQFKDGATSLGSPVSLVGGSASFSTAALSVASHSITAVYSGDGNFNATGVGTSTAPAISQVVVYTFIGFLQPVDNPPVINTGNPGRTYPIKWQLKDANGNYVSDLGSFVSLQYTVVTCGAFDLSLSSTLDTTATGGTVLRYDATANQFIYNWQTPNPSNACYALTLTLKDGTTHLADFQMKK